MKYWIWLSHALGVASAKLKILIEQYGDAEHLYHLSPSALSKVSILSPAERKRFADKDLSFVEKILETCKKTGISLITYPDSAYPNRLRQIDNPPACIYCKGELPDIDAEPIICIVGQRKATDYGKRAAWSLAARLAAGGMTVVSGGALGIDSAALHGSIDAGGKAIAVLGCGINYPYLMQNAPLRDQISKNGCLISEYPPEARVYGHNFPVRNRLMSALSLGVIVIEAPEGSGSLITACHALEQGKDVYVITGRHGDANYAGSNALLKDGAKPVFDADDVFLEYVNLFPDKIDSKAAKEKKLKAAYQNRFENAEVLAVSKRKATHSAPPKTNDSQTNKKFLQEKINESLSKNAQIVYNSINSDFFTMDDLLLCGLPFEDVLTAVTELELLGVILAQPGGRYSIS